MPKSIQISLTREGDLDEAFVQLCKAVVSKRPRTVIDHILEHGLITNEDLSDLYHYDHPPRAIRDVRENGIPLVTHSIKSPKTGRKIGAYTFGSPKDVQRGRIGGRRAFPKNLKAQLIDHYGSRDAFSHEPLEQRYLQIDHRVPYAISGDPADIQLADFMLIDASSQRAKSWSCEHCANLAGAKDPNVCKECFWAYPEGYGHVAMEPKRRLDIAWSGAEVSEFENARRKAEALGISLADFIKQQLRK